jgi:hypothetical protein
MQLRVLLCLTLIISIVAHGQLADETSQTLPTI